MEQLLHPILFTEIIGLYHFGIKRMKNRKMDAGFLDLRKTACFHGFMNAGGILWPWPSAGNRRFYLNITPRSRMKSKNLCKKKRAQSGSIPGRLCSWDMEREFTQT